jgi:tryptophanyl-tRNA synthetase
MELYMSKPVILTGLRANNDLHIGNYLGALLPLVDMATQKAGDYQINLFVPDLHSFTTPIDHAQLQAGIMQNLRVFVAAGLPLDNPDVHIYRQSYIQAHSELTWILDCFTGMGEMGRMTQFKDKSRLTEGERDLAAAALIEELTKALQEGKIDTNQVDEVAKKTAKKAIEQIEERKSSNASVGLFNYPVLMAADILLYGAKYVPVGDDQTQHLEFTRDIGERLSKRFGSKLFIVPEPAAKQHEFFGKDQGLRIRDLQNPAKKMSKSDDTGKGVIFLTDSQETARKKIMSAETDSVGSVNYGYQNQPGISNLLDMLKLFGGNSDEFIGQNQYGPLKTAVAEKVAAFLGDFQTKLAAVNDQRIIEKLESSESDMRAIAGRRLLAVQRAVGLRP